jgi:hypothetical protein
MRYTSGVGAIWELSMLVAHGALLGSRVPTSWLRKP